MKITIKTAKPLLLLTSVLLFSMLQISAYAGSISQHAMESAVLSRPLVYSLYTPDAYAESTQNFPVLYLLHGAAGSETSWIRSGDIVATADALIASGAIPPMLIVMPADPNFWWADSHLEFSQTALISELIPHIDATLRTQSQRGGRLIAGYSAGGFGATNAALKFPELFAAAAPLSPAVYDPVPPPSSSATRVEVFQKNGQFDAERWRSLNWVSVFGAYKNKGIVVPFYINSGDHDRFDIAYHAAAFYQQLREHQPELVELRIFDGDHDFAAWGGSIGDAMTYMARFLQQ
ncbi:MAG: alpha/beta hydrolase-fold protein [Pseudohongiella sp.]|nr:alpha/beta hydrolase-fold protein [Pseudohongiella sp.]MDO9520198.1 alpha/beta hydrolase-fold protein [Pseudohongiella sp.]MDP2125929.1 alpha/beta hydrolase-fold protein [Pseudohongiella sp.]